METEISNCCWFNALLRGCAWQPRSGRRMYVHYIWVWNNMYYGKDGTSEIEKDTERQKKKYEPESLLGTNNRFTVAIWQKPFSNKMNAICSLNKWNIIWSGSSRIVHGSVNFCCCLSVSRSRFSHFFFHSQLSICLFRWHILKCLIEFRVFIFAVLSLTLNKTYRISLLHCHCQNNNSKNAGYSKRIEPIGV